jgi:mRNA-decapping enzyme subunit 2
MYSSASSFDTDTIDPPSNKSVAYQEALEDVHTRFILNLPDSELQTADRIFFQLEQAWWFYEDLICDPRPELNLPRYSSFKPFARMLFEYSPLLPDVNKFSEMWQQYTNYKRKISNYGCILLTADWKKIILCQVYNGKTYMLPTGKINQGEDGPAAAARETYEETGFDPSCKAGKTAEWQESDPAMITWNTSLTEQDMLVHQEDNGGKRRTCYVIAGVPEDFPFAPVSRKEVSNIAWFGIENIPPSFGVLPFMKPLRNWIKKKAKKKQRDQSSGKGRESKSRERGKKSATPHRSRHGSRGRNDSRGRVVQSENDDLVASGLANTGDSSGWSEEDMFLVNEKILGRKVEYDGNPHVFAEEGLSKADPHAFRIVGGSFLNSGGAGSLAPPPDRSRLQPLFRNEARVEGLTPFFSEDGATPWGEVVQEVKICESTTRSSATNKKKTKQLPKHPQEIVGLDDDDGGILPTDAQITSKSQASKSSSTLQQQYERDMEFVRQWVANLPKPTPTKHFGVFKLDADAIMAQAERDVAALR